MWSSWPCVTTTPAIRCPKRLERPEVRVDDVDAEPAVVERDAAVDEQHVAALLDGHAVHAHLAEAAERKHPQTRGGGETAATTART